MACRSIIHVAAPSFPVKEAIYFRFRFDYHFDDVCFLLKKDDAFCLVAFSKKKTITTQKSYAVVGGGVAATFLR